MIQTLQKKVVVTAMAAVTVLLLFLLFPVRAFVVMLVAACIGAALTSLALSLVKLVRKGSHE